jgi:hypothetical protein
MVTVDFKNLLLRRRDSGGIITDGIIHGLVVPLAATCQIESDPARDGGEGVVLREVHVPQSKPAGADAQVLHGTAEAVRRAFLQDASRSRAWWSVPELLFRAALTVGVYRTTRAYLWSLGY